MTDTISIHQSFLMPASNGAKAVPVDVDGIAVVNSDQLHDALDGLSDSLSQQRAIINNLTEKVSEISEYGVGFDDAIGIVAIPLIIALFAFSFTFLFSVITRINNEYLSQPISRMFSSSKPYARFMQTSIGSVVFVIVVGALLLAMSGTVHVWAAKIMTWLTLAVALYYALVILRFVKTCIRYNDPSQMIDIIDERYAEDMKGVAKYLKKQKKEEKKNEEEKSEHKKYFKNMGFWYGRVYAGFNAEEERINRLVDLFKYALGKNNRDLTLGVIIQANNLIKEEKRAGEEKEIHHAMEFYDRAIDAYLSCPQNNTIEDDLMMYWSSGFNRTQLPSGRYVYRTLKMVVEAVTNGRHSLFKAYVGYVTYAYSYVNRLQTAIYVRGGSIEEQKKADKERMEFWAELRDVHFLATAYLFSLGHVEILNTLLFRKDKGYGDLFPNTGLDALRLYARCKLNQTEDNGYHYYSASEVIGDYPDPEMLEKYTAALLLVLPQKIRDYDTLISQEKLDAIKENEAMIATYGDMWKGLDEIRKINLQVSQQDVGELIAQYVKVLGNGDQLNKTNEEKDLCARMIEGLKHMLCRVGKRKSLYDVEICELAKRNVETHYWNWLYGNKSSLADGLASDDEEDKKGRLQLGVYTFLIYKHVLCKPEGLDPLGLHNETMKVFKGRYQRLFYQAMTGMQIKDEEVEKDGLGDYVSGILNEKGEEYVIIETDLSLLNFVELDKIEKRYPWRNRFKKAELHPIDLDTSFYMRDFAEMEQFRGTLLLIKKENLPALEGETEDASPAIEFKDESDRNKGMAAVRVTIDPKMVVKYNENAQVIRVKVKGQKLL